MTNTYRSPNYSPRHNHSIKMLVIHATVGTLRSALAWLTSASAQVSAHYVIDKRGQVYQLVPDEYAAWHAGRASWRGETAINEISIGIELENANDGRDPYPAEQVDALLRLAREKVGRYQIAPNMVVRHLDVALPHGRKTDPAGFPWAEFLQRLFPETPTPPNERPPRPAPPATGSAALRRALLAEAYRQVGAGDRLDWAIPQFAQTEGLGLPIGPSFDLGVGGRSYIAQSFGKDTLASPIGEWQKIDRLSALAGPAQQALLDALREAVYAQAGESYHPDWAFHQYALRQPLGPPLSASFRLSADGREYVAACYAMDTIYSPVGEWKTIARLSDLASPAEDGAGRPGLAEALQEHLYQRAGSRLRADWPLHQYAIKYKLGAPLGPSYRVSVEGRDYVAEAFALDVVYCEAGAWKSPARLSALPD